MSSRPANALLVTVGAAVASFGFLTLVILGLAAGGSVGGLPAGLLLAAALGVGWLFGVRWAWRRLARPAGPAG
jgi:hypothetical protein